MKINLYTFGNSNKFKTWSNVPKLLSEAININGDNCFRIDLSPRTSKPFWFFEYVFFRFYRTLLSLFKKNSMASYDMTGFNRSRINNLISKKSNKEANIDLFFSFSFGKRSKPNNKLILIHDWNKSWEIENLHNRKLDPIELYFKNKEVSVLKSADHIFCLFPGFISSLKSYNISNSKVHYIGPHVNVPSTSFSSNISIQNNFANQKVVFIGNRKYYQSGLDALIESLNFVSKDITVDVIGFEQSSNPISDNVNFHGYLDKDIPEQRDLFYKLLKEASVFINTTPHWGAFSSCCEAMYLKTPVIVNNYKEFTDVFPNARDFAVLIEGNSPKTIAKSISKIMSDYNKYYSMCTIAHESVKDYTWDNHAEFILKTIENE